MGQSVKAGMSCCKASHVLYAAFSPIQGLLVLTLSTKRLADFDALSMTPWSLGQLPSRYKSLFSPLKVFRSCHKPIGE